MTFITQRLANLNRQGRYQMFFYHIPGQLIRDAMTFITQHLADLNGGGKLVVSNRHHHHQKYEHEHHQHESCNHL